MNRKLIIILWLLVAAFGARAQGLKRAVVLLEKKDYPKVQSLLAKLIQKDSLNPGAYYISSLLYLTNTFPKHNLDSSYYFVIKAIDQITGLDKKEVVKLQKNNFSDSIFQTQKKKIDQLAFAEALAENTVIAFSSFIEKHHDAAEIKKAVVLRNKVAFANARQANTYQSYKQFIDTYPNAAQNVEANNIYQQLIYREKTKDGSLGSAAQFLKSHPDTPFYNLLLKNIFELLTADNQSDSYLTFIRNYPGNIYTKHAVDLWFYNQIENGVMAIEAAKQCPEAAYSDSLQNMAAINTQKFIPFLDQGVVKFMDLTGTAVNVSFDKGELGNRYFCDGVAHENIVLNFLNHKKVYTKNGDLLFKDQFDELEAMPFGFSKIKKLNHHGLIHNSGWLVLKPEYEHISFLSNQFILVKEKGYYGLKTFAGRTVIKSNFDKINLEGKFYIFEKDEKIAITNQQDLLSFISGKSANPTFRYDDYQLINPDLLKVFKDDQEGLLDVSLRPLLPLTQQKIYMDKTGCIVIRNDSLVFYDTKFEVISSIPFEEYQFAHPWIGIRKGEKWAITRAPGLTTPTFKYDSLKILNFGIVWLRNVDNELLRLANGHEIKLNEDISFELMKATTLNPQDIESNDHLILLTNKKKKQTTLFNENGDKITILSLYTVNAFDGQNLVVTKNGKKGILDLNGKTMVPTQFDAITKSTNDNFSLLAKGKFGLFKAINKTYLKPIYSKAITDYNKAYFIVEKSGKKGLVNNKNKSVTPFLFEKIKHWNDSVALTFQNGNWGLYHVENNEFVLNDLLTVKIVDESEGKTAIISTKSGYGLLHSEKGNLLGPTFNDILVIGNQQEYLFFCEKFVREADLYVVLYLNKKGEILKKQVYNADEYEKVYCRH